MLKAGDVGVYLTALVGKIFVNMGFRHAPLYAIQHK
jgi:hypothetical protein